MTSERSTPAGLAGAVLGVTCWAAGNVMVVEAPMEGRDGLTGTPGGGGRHTGTARVIHTPAQLHRVQPRARIPDVAPGRPRAHIQLSA